jgi:hypothetical protein
MKGTEKKMSREEPQFEGLIRQLEFVFAKTMPENPHWYATRRPANAQAFDAVMQMYKRHAKPEKWRGKTYRVWRPGDGYQYWGSKAQSTASSS